MRHLLKLGETDLRNIYREKIMLVVFVGAPVAYLAFAMYAVPWLVLKFPMLQEYLPVLFFITAAQLGSTFGLVTANIILDEKDQDVLQAIKVLPMSSSSFLAFRLVVPTIISVVFVFFLVYLPDIIALSRWQAAQSALLFSIIAPQMTLIMTILAGNKVEGLAIFKFLNLILILPAVDVFLPSHWDFVLAVIPSFWIYKWILDPSSSLLFTAAVVVQFVFLWFLLIRFRKRLF